MNVCTGYNVRAFTCRDGVWVCANCLRPKGEYARALALTGCTPTQDDSVALATETLTTEIQHQEENEVTDTVVEEDVKETKPSRKVAAVPATAEGAARKARREAAGISRAQLSAASGLSQAVIGRIELGNSKRSNGAELAQYDEGLNTAVTTKGVRVTSDAEDVAAPDPN